MQEDKVMKNKQAPRYRKFRGKIRVEAHRHYVEFFRGVQGREPIHTIGNYEVGMGTCDLLEALGHTLLLIDTAEEEDEADTDRDQREAAARRRHARQVAHAPGHE